jgi:hypothetical protein
VNGQGFLCVIALSYDIGYIESVRFSGHFEEDRQDAPDRGEITLEMCEQVKAQPLAQDSENQPRGRTTYWGNYSPTPAGGGSRGMGRASVNLRVRWSARGWIG